MSDCDVLRSHVLCGAVRSCAMSGGGACPWDGDTGLGGKKERKKKKENSGREAAGRCMTWHNHRYMKAWAMAVQSLDALVMDEINR